MKLTGVKISVEVARSKDFQSTRVGMEATVEIAEGENKVHAVTQARRWMAAQCRDGAQEELEAVLYGPGYRKECNVDFMPRRSRCRLYYCDSNGPRFFCPTRPQG